MSDRNPAGCEGILSPVGERARLLNGGFSKDDLDSGPGAHCRDAFRAEARGMRFVEAHPHTGMVEASRMHELVMTGVEAAIITSPRMFLGSRDADRAHDLPSILHTRVRPAPQGPFDRRFKTGGMVD